MKSISLPDTLKKIGYFGIAGCTSLETLKLPDSITEIQKAGLARNLILKSVNIPKGLTSIPEYCLMGCPELKELNIPDNIKFIGDKAFSLSGMSSIRLPEGVGIEPSILDGCKGLKSITIGERTVINLDELGENLTFEGLRKTIDKKTGKEQWGICYSDERGEIHTHEVQGVMSVEEKKAQIVREQNAETVSYFHDQKSEFAMEQINSGKESLGFTNHVIHKNDVIPIAKKDDIIRESESAKEALSELEITQEIEKDNSQNLE